MTRQMKKAVYEAPLTEHFQVELEGVFCGSIVTQQDAVSISEQEINTDFAGSSFTGTGDTSHNGWSKEGGW